MNQYDNEFANDLSQHAFGDQPRRSWFSRNWLWFVPTIILLPIFCCCGGGGALVWFSVGKLFEIAPLQDSIALADQNAEVQKAIGTPIDTPDSFMGLVSMMQQGGQLNFKQNGSQFLFDARVPLQGPNGSGTLLVDAESYDGGVTWNYTVQQVELPDGTVIDLLPAVTPAAPDASDVSEAEQAIDAARNAIEQFKESTTGDGSP